MTFKYTAAIAAAGLWSFTALSGGLAYGADPLSREDAIARTLEAAPILEAMQENIAAAGAGILQAGVKPNPQIGADIENFTGTGPFSGLDRTEFTVSYAQRYERGGKRGLRTRLAHEDKKISVAEWHIRRLEVIQRVESAYVAAVVAKARLKSREQQVAIFEQIEAAIKKRVEAGRDPDLAAQNAYVRLLGAQSRAAAAKLALDAAKLSLASLWQGRIDSFEVDESSFETLPNALMARTPDMVQEGPDLVLWQRKQERTKASLALEKARAVQDPTFKVGLRYHQNSSDVAAVAGVSIPLAIHDTNRGNISRAKAHVNRSRYELMDVERQLGRQLMIAHAAQAGSFKQARQLERNLAAALEAKSLVMDRLERGVASYLDVFAAQALMAEIEEQRIETLARFHSAQVTINRLTTKYDANAMPSSGASEATDGLMTREGY